MMHILGHNFTPDFRPPDAVASFAARLSRWTAIAQAALPMPSADAPILLTTDALRAELLALGLPGDAQSLAVADALTQLGLPLTRATMTEAQTALLRAPHVSPLAFALARTLGLPTTPITLRALSAVTQGIPDSQAVSGEMSAWLTVGVDAAEEPDTLAESLHRMAHGSAARRTALLHLAQETGAAARGQAGADTLAAHLAGQHLINESAQAASDSANPSPLYFAVPVQLGAEWTMAEMRLWPAEDEEQRAARGEESAPLRACIRLTTARLGRVQADIVGTSNGELSCTLGIEQSATARLFQRHAEILGDRLAAMGWHVSTVKTERRTQFPPLWHISDALSAPRTRIDRTI